MTLALISGLFIGSVLGFVGAGGEAGAAADLAAAGDDLEAGMDDLDAAAGEADLEEPAGAEGSAADLGRGRR